MPHSKIKRGYPWFALLTLLSGTVVWIRTATVKNTYTYVKYERELRELQQEIQSLRVRWLKATAPKKLENYAVSLNLAPPKLEQVLKAGTLTAQTGIKPKTLTTNLPSKLPR